MKHLLIIILVLSVGCRDKPKDAHVFHGYDSAWSNYDTLKVDSNSSPLINGGMNMRSPTIRYDTLTVDTCLKITLTIFRQTDSVIDPYSDDDTSGWRVYGGGFTQGKIYLLDLLSERKKDTLWEGKKIYYKRKAIEPVGYFFKSQTDTDTARVYWKSRKKN